MDSADRKIAIIGALILAFIAAVFVVFLVIFKASAGEKHEQALRQMAWCHDLGGTYTNDIHDREHNGVPRFDGPDGTCEVSPTQPLRGDCYTTEESAPTGVPVGVNWYAYYLLGKGGAGAGGLDEYAHCAGSPVVRPRGTSP